MADLSVSKISVFVLAENRLLREALARILNNKSDINVVGSGCYSPSVIQDVAATCPQVILCDPLLEALSELALVADLLRSVPGLKVVLIGMDANRDLFLRGVRAGIVGYLLKDATAAEIAAAVRAVANHEAVCPPDLCRALFEYVAGKPAPFPSFALKQHLGLTRREQQLVEMIGRGYTNKEIAVSLSLSEQTIKNHIHRMLRKIGASDRLKAVEMCRQTHFLPAYNS